MTLLSISQGLGRLVGRHFFLSFFAKLFLGGREDELCEFFNTSVIAYFSNFVDLFYHMPGFSLIDAASLYHLTLNHQ